MNNNNVFVCFCLFINLLIYFVYFIYFNLDNVSSLVDILLKPFGFPAHGTFNLSVLQLIGL